MSVNLKKRIYVNKKCKWQCSEGHVWYATLNNIVNNEQWCPFCRGFYRTVKDLHIAATKKGGKCLSKKYVKSQTKYKWQCSKGHTWWAQFASIKRGSWCEKCSFERRVSLQRMFTVDQLQKLAKKYDGQCLSKKYQHISIPLNWKCKNGHVFKKSVTQVLYKNSWCPTCKRNKQFYTFDEFIQKIKKLKVYTQQQYRSIYKIYKKLPAEPSRFYKNQWKGWTYVWSGG